MRCPLKSLLNISSFLTLSLFLTVSGLMAQTVPLQISDIQLSNFRGNTFTITWRTNRPTTTNQVLYGKSPSNLTLVKSDSLPSPSLVHFVHLALLDIDSTYYYKVRSDGLEKANSALGYDSVHTVQQELPPTPLLLVGTAADQFTNQPLDNVIVLSYYKWFRTVSGNVLVDSTGWVAVLTRSDGGFVMDIANYRQLNGQTAQYFAGSTWLYLKFLSQSQGVLQDSVLLTVQRGTGNFQDLGIFKVTDERKGANRGIITATGPVLANNISASVVNVTVLDKDGQPIPNVEIAIRATPDRGVRYLQPQKPTDAEGKVWGLVYSDVAEPKSIKALNMSAPDSTALDTFATVEFITPLNADIALDTVAPFIYFTTEYPNTQDNAGPYRITSRVVDNFTVRTELLWTIQRAIYADTVDMVRATGTDNFNGDIPGQPVNSVINYYVVAQDTAGHRSSKPDSIHASTFIPPYRFEILTEGGTGVPRMGINRTTDALNTLNSILPVRIETRISSNVGILSAVLKWRNLDEGPIFFDVKMQQFGSAWWGYIPNRPPGSRVEYFIQVSDSMGGVERDPRLAPNSDIFTYEVLSSGSLGSVTFADTTARLGTTDVTRSWHADFGDFNDDRNLDIVVANYGQPNKVYFFNPGIGLQDNTFDALGNQPSENTTHVAVADVNADDFLDLIFTNDGSQSRLYLNNGRGRFEDVTLNLFAPTGTTYLPVETWNSTCVVAEDFDGDGAVDLYIANNAPGGQKNRLLFNNRSGIFTDVTDLKIANEPLSQSVWTVTGDLDGDKDLDIVVINRAQEHYWLRNAGKGVFQYRQLSSGAAPTARAGDLADVDNDGDLDLIVGCSETQQNELYINDGKGAFARDQSRLPAESDNTFGVKFFDANADGYVDIYYSNSGQPNRLILNDSKGFFYEAPAEMMPSYSANSRFAATLDINNDNRPDLYVAEEDRRNTLIFSRSFDPNSADLPSVFDLVSPRNNDTLNTTTATFIWKSSDTQDSTEVLRYDFLLSLDSLFTFNNVVSQVENLTDTSLSVSNLNDNTSYWWKVVARGASGFPVNCRTPFKFKLLTSYQGQGPDFVVLLSRNPVFTGHITIYIIASEPLRSTPALTINLQNISVSQVGTYDIWRAQYSTRSSFLLSVSGVNLAGTTGEYSNTYASALASAGAKSIIATPDRQAWLTLEQGAVEGTLRVLAQSNPVVANEKLKERLAALSGLGDAATEDLALISAGNSFTFSALEGGLATFATVSLRSAGAEADIRPVICILKQGRWLPLETVYDPAAGIYSARTGELGTFSLRAAGYSTTDLPKAAGYSLAQNAPNPFNPSTFITFSVPGSGPAENLSIKIYNLRGSLVRTLVEGPQAAGIHTVQWTGQADDGRDLPSGVYFYRMTAPGMTVTRKMVLLR